MIPLSCALGFEFCFEPPISHIIFHSITHYYHWSAELWFGFWRTYSSLDPNITPEGNTTLPFARRIMFSHLDANHWRDYAHMNEWVVRASFPSVTLEFIDDWRDRAELGKPFVFDRVLVADRSAAMRSYNFHRYQRTAAAAFALPGNMNWWMPIRNNVVEFAGLDPNVGGGTTSTPVITYISRQEWGRRMLIPADHDKLVEELYKLRDNYGYEVNIVAAEKMTRVEQIRLAARTTVCVHLFVLSKRFPLNRLIYIDYDGCTWKRPNFSCVDETQPTSNSYGILLSGRFCA